MRMRSVAVFVVVLVGTVSPALAGRKAVLRAVANAMFPMTATQVVDSETCGCMLVECAGGLPLFCGGGAGELGRLGMLKAAIPEPDGCRVCACNLGGEPITFIGVANCLAVP